MLFECGASLHLIECLDGHDVHWNEVVADAIFLCCSEQEWHNQVQVVIKDLSVELWQEEDDLLRHSDVLQGQILLCVVDLLGLASTPFDQVQDFRQDKVHVRE